MGSLLVSTTKTAFRPPYTWVGECIDQCAVGLRRCWLPLFLSITFFAVGLVVTTVGGVLGVIGTVDRFGNVAAYGWPRETGFWVASMVFAGVVGAAVTADLGARKIREELDAIRVFGVDPVRTLVVPRIAALVIIAPLLSLAAVLNANVILYLVSPSVLGLPHAAYLSGWEASITSGDMISLVLRSMVTGLFVGVVSCYKGLATEGGAEGVGRAVNQTVVITFFGIWLLNGLWNAVFLAAFPSVSVFRG
jgi:phospholipid/cholesterol/gamma-HCH transport system permease protein